MPFVVRDPQSFVAKEKSGWSRFFSWVKSKTISGAF
jgi:hypothetical protein